MARSLFYHGCPNCAQEYKAQKFKKPQEQFEEEMENLHPDIMPLEPYRNNRFQVLCKCLVCGHEWRVSPGSLIKQGTGCPKCARSSTSYVEQYILLLCRQAWGDASVLSRDRTAIGKELDIYIPDASLAIEYGSYYWHKGKIERDLEKRNLCKNQGIRLINIYDFSPEDFQFSTEEDVYSFECSIGEENISLVRDLVFELIDEYGHNVEWNSQVLEKISKQAYMNSRHKTTDSFALELSQISPSITVLGNYEKATKNILVKCTICGNEWSAYPSNLLKGRGCSRCAQKDLIQRASKQVRCIETGEVYSSATAASRATGIGSANIGCCCRGKTKTAGGYHWVFV